MKYYLFLSLILVCLLADAQLPNYVPTDGLIGWYPFNGNANDESGNGNNGSFTGSSCNVCGTNQVTAPPTTTEDRFNNVNSAYGFDNQLDFISVQNSSTLQLTNEYTISTWLNPSTLDFGNFNFGVILAKWGNTGDASYQIRMGSDGKIMYDTQNGSTTTTLLSSSSLNLNQWTNVLITQQLNSVSIFINGSLDNQSSSMNIPIVSNSTVEIGRNYNQFSNYANEGFIGTLDDIGIWNRVLTEEEIQNLYNANICYDHVTVTDTLIINFNMTGFNPVTYEHSIEIYPNPTSDHITINYGDFVGLNGYTLSIFNPMGQLVHNSNITQQQEYLDLNTWGGMGVYQVVVYSPQGVPIETRQIVLQ